MCILWSWVISNPIETIKNKYHGYCNNNFSQTDIELGLSMHDFDMHFNKIMIGSLSACYLLFIKE